MITIYTRSLYKAWMSLLGQGTQVNNKYLLSESMIQRNRSVENMSLGLLR